MSKTEIAAENKKRAKTGQPPYPCSDWEEYHDHNCYGTAHYCDCHRSFANVSVAAFSNKRRP